MLFQILLYQTLEQIMRVETGAVFIYKGILLISKDREIIEFANNHLLTEKNI